MSIVFRINDGLYIPQVTAKAVMPLPPLPGDGGAVDVAEGDEITELELLTITGPPTVVASAVDALAAHLEELVPKIAHLYNDHESPQHGG
ncbi:hypothetical protein GA0070610_1797 [Micromonospora echinofusca]|uniref:Uncharacterized protein n=1 Tax=Micromonospora echinofusca TaxID=47858 RepID=A0A1C5G6K8_MICEH|nr:hypothetical protein [Micromonospora echinofusca]SCG15563.1 hypothetical protein GA0070610_1797 [Micromonospora echinofusca]